MFFVFIINRVYLMLLPEEDEAAEAEATMEAAEYVSCFCTQTSLDILESFAHKHLCFIYYRASWLPLLAEAEVVMAAALMLDE